MGDNKKKIWHKIVVKRREKFWSLNIPKLWVSDSGLSSPLHFADAQRNKKEHPWIVPCKAHMPSPTKRVDYQNERRAMLGVLWQQ